MDLSYYFCCYCYYWNHLHSVFYIGSFLLFEIFCVFDALFCFCAFIAVTFVSWHYNTSYFRFFFVFIVHGM
jgi:hypothetical protein